ncbi:hypothetical protein VTJ49DRAFT_5978 [Mycothermus thermophilus]|uniref:CCHC-type domain-containing protein n=1 Tax=Humicola insolens TaxID=85995 RepID=A0ABR3V261_HUMIN
MMLPNGQFRKFILAIFQAKVTGDSPPPRRGRGIGGPTTVAQSGALLLSGPGRYAAEQVEPINFQTSIALAFSLLTTDPVPTTTRWRTPPGQAAAQAAAHTGSTAASQSGAYDPAHRGKKRTRESIRERTLEAGRLQARLPSRRQDLLSLWKPGQVAPDDTKAKLHSVDPKLVFNEPRYGYGETSVLQAPGPEFNWFARADRRPNVFWMKAPSEKASLEAFTNTLLSLARDHGAGMLNFRVELQSFKTSCQDWDRLYGEEDDMRAAKRQRQNDLPVAAAARTAIVTCANCNEPGHVMGDCVRPSWRYGSITGCAKCNDKTHHLDNCRGMQKYDPKTEEGLKFLVQFFIADRLNKPPFRSEKFHWFDLLEHFANQKVSNKDQLANVVNWPWTIKFCRDFVYGKHTMEDLPTDPFWDDKTGLDVLQMRNAGQLDGERFVSQHMMENPSAGSQTGAPTTSSGSSATTAPRRSVFRNTLANSGLEIVPVDSNNDDDDDLL